jgi:acyl carrier protein
MGASSEIDSRVTNVLVEALNVEEGDISPEATLQGDLGAESIDILDIIFRLEREFGIHIPRSELFPEAIFQGDPEVIQDGRVTDKGMEMLRARMPFADLDPFARDRRLTSVPDLFTVDLLHRYLAWKLPRETPTLRPAEQHC